MESSVDFGKELVALVQELNPIERGIVVAPNIEMDTQRLAPDVENKELLFATNAAALRTEGALKVGTACSVAKFYYCNHGKDKNSFLLEEVESVSYEGKNRFGTYSPGDTITVLLRSGEKHILGECMIGLDGMNLAKLLSSAAKDAPLITDPALIRCLSLSELGPELQANYMKILYNYAYLSDCQVDSAEYAVLQSIMVRIGMEAQVRNELRDYLFLMQQGDRVKTGVLIHRCRNAMSYGSYELFRYSLMQDILYLHKASNADGHCYDDPFINGLQDTLEITDDQIETMQAAITLYQKMQEREADLAQLQEQMERLWNHAKAVRIPHEALFCSGSVYSVDTYHGWNRNKKLGRSITRQRELMLQAVIRNTQESLNHLVEDMNDVTLKLVEEVRRGNHRDELIEQLSQRMIQFQRQAKAMAHHSTEMNLTSLYNRLPAHLSAERVVALIPQHRELVEQCYALAANGEYQIKEDLSARELAALGRIRGITDNE